LYVPSKAAKWRRNLSGQKKEDLEKKTKPERKRHPNLKIIKEMNRLQGFLLHLAVFDGTCIGVTDFTVVVLGDTAFVFVDCFFIFL
jgi:hypothetical protein